MANIIAIFTAIILCSSIYVAHKNHEKLKVEIENRQIQEENMRQNQETLADLRQQRDETKDLRLQTEATVAARRTDEENQIALNTGLKQDIDSKTQEKESNARQIEQIEEQTKELGMVSEIAGKVRSLRNRIQSLEDEKATKEEKLSNVIAEKNSTQATIDEYDSQNAAIARRESYFTEAKISAVHGTWGFVTINMGDATGVVAGSKLNVMRGGVPIARLRVTAVESNRASADIVPGSLAEDTVLMTGDSVAPIVQQEQQ